jgi:magnesium transporter
VSPTAPLPSAETNATSPSGDLTALGQPCGCQVIGLDFRKREETALAAHEISDALRADQFVWIELCTRDSAAARSFLECLGLVDDAAIGAALSRDAVSSYSRYDRHLHLVLTPLAESDLAERRIDVLLGERFLITLYTHRISLLDTLRREYRSDFLQFARTPSFLLYEIWDQLLQNYLNVQKRLEARVEALQLELKEEQVDGAVFGRVSDLGADLLKLRRVALPARTVLTDLATRRSLFISDTTQQALANLSGTAEHLLGDLVTDRELLSESVDLHMSRVTHRTNEVMKRLTVVSVVFLPLTFIVGVYGMNFEHLPELHWRYGYAYFWLLVAVVVAGLLAVLRRARFW